MEKQWKRIRSEYGEDLKLFKPRFDWMHNLRNDVTEKMIILEAQDASNVVAVTKDQQILFVRQYRFGIRQETLELPGGIVDSGELPEVAAKRELSEETGYGGGQWSYLGKIGSNPVFMDSYIHHWVASNVEPGYQGELDDGENIEVELLDLEEVKKKLYSGYFLHPHTVSGLVRFFGV